MGLKYVSSDSSNLMTALEQNITQIKSELDTLSTGANQLVLAVDGRTLSGAAYTAASGLFSECIIPAIQKTKSAVDAIQTDLSTYKTQDGTVSGEGVLDEDELNRQLTSLKSQKTSAEQMSSYLSTQVLSLSRQKGTDYASYIGQLNSSITSLSTMISSLDSDIAEVERKLKLLREFSANTSSLFTGAKEGLSVSMQAMAALSLAQINADGTYTLPPGVDASWFTKESKDFKDSFYFAVANMPKSFTEEEAQQWVLDQLDKHGEKTLAYLKQPLKWAGRGWKIVQNYVKWKNGKAYLSGIPITVDATGRLKWGAKYIYKLANGHQYKQGKQFASAMSDATGSHFKWDDFIYSKDASGKIIWKNVGKAGWTSFKNTFIKGFDFKSKIDVKANFKSWKNAYNSLGKIGKTAKVFGKGLGIVSTVASVGGNWAANTKKGKTDWVGFGSDVVVDFTAGAGATAVGSAVGSLFLPPLGTVVGAGVGMVVSSLVNQKIPIGNPPKSVVGHLKSGAKSLIKWALGG